MSAKTYSIPKPFEIPKPAAPKPLARKYVGTYGGVRFYADESMPKGKAAFIFDWREDAQ